MTAEIFDRYGNPITAGPYVAGLTRCTECRQLVEYDQRTREYLNARRQRCTPHARSARCLWEHLRLPAVNPRYLPGHHGRCQCQDDISHHVGPAQAYPFPQQIPWHCGQPAHLSPQQWVCRSRRCRWSTPTGPAHP